MYLINGQLHADCNLDSALHLLQRTLAHHLDTPLESATVITAAQIFAQQLESNTAAVNVDDEQRRALRDFCQPQALRIKLERELGKQPHSLRRINYRQAHFESWRPLGLVVHITPANAPLLGFCAMIESLLAGNVNWLRPSSSDQGLTAHLLNAFLMCDPSGQLCHYVAVLPVATSQIGVLCSLANGVAAWGGETALQAIRQQIPPGCRWIDWGHRISFVYLTPDAASDQVLDALADEVCRLDQQACSSPQWLLVDSDNPAILSDIGAALANAFERRAGQWPALTPTLQEWSQITTHVAMTRLDKSFSGQSAEIWSGARWRVIWSHDQELTPSPLFRTLLLKPLPRAQITQTLLPWRNVLQSCALTCSASQTGELSRALIAAGVTRIAPLNAIHCGYDGEPHDGVYALQRLSRRVSVSVSATQLHTHMTLDRPRCAPPLADLSIIDKQTLIKQPVAPTAQLFFRSGGSSGTPTLSAFSYHDFERQMRAAADGLFAAGLNPNRDKVMNLFYSGGLYGGFFSFSKVLEILGATHLPMGAPGDDDYSEITKMIVEQRVNVLIGMPSTLHRLFLNEQQTLRCYGGLEKVFLGGEHLSEHTRELLQSCGVTCIRSALYGSVDAGPFGHACASTADGEFHLMSEIQHLEIVSFTADIPVTGREVGRLLFTSTAREAQQIQRYDVGDSGRWLTGPCACGLKTPRFELRQRHGRLVRIGTDFICLDELARHLQVPFQLFLDHAADGLERLRLRTPDQPMLINARLQNYPKLAELILARLLTIEVEVCQPAQFCKNKHSGKTPLLIDSRR